MVRVCVCVVGLSCLMRDAAPVASPSMGIVLREVMSMPAEAFSGVRIVDRGTMMLVTAAAVDRVVKIRRDSSSGNVDV